MRAGLLIAALLATVPAVAAGAPPPQSQKVVITSSSRTDKSAPQNDSHAASIASGMENITAIAIARAYPCSEQITTSEFGELVGYQRLRYLLGSDDPAELVALAGGLNARYLMSVVVTQLGGQSTVNVMLMDTTTGRAVARDLTTIPWDDHTYAALDSFAKKFVGGLGDAFPKCPGPWRGTVTITKADKVQGISPGKGPYSAESSLTVTCTIEQPQDSARCDVSFSASLAGNGASTTSAANGSVEAYVTTSVRDGKASISVSQLQIKGTVAVSIAGASDGGPDTFSFGPWSAQGPSTGDANHSSGRVTDDTGTTISWSLSRK